MASLRDKLSICILTGINVMPRADDETRADACPTARFGCSKKFRSKCFRKFLQHPLVRPERQTCRHISVCVWFLASWFAWSVLVAVIEKG